MSTSSFVTPLSLNLYRKFSAAALLLALFTLSAYAQSAPRYKELPNFYKVNDRLYRGAQPEAGGMKKLKELGVQTILNLRGEGEETRTEQKAAEEAGLKYIGLPMPGLSSPDDAAVEQALKIIDDPANGVVFVHCKHGADRTGTVIACYRISHENVDGVKATAEARKYGMSWVQFGMRGYISDYYKKYQSRKATTAKAL